MGSLADYFEDPVHVKIIDCLLDATTDLSKKQIAKNCGISKATLFNHWKSLEKLGLVKVTRKFGKTKLYQIDKENQIIKKLLELKNVLQGIQIPQKKIAEISPIATSTSPPSKAIETSQVVASSTTPLPPKPSFFRSAFSFTRFKRFKLPPIKKAKKRPKTK